MLSDAGMTSENREGWLREVRGVLFPLHL